MQMGHQNRNQQMPVIGAGRDAIQQQHALETALVQVRAELRAELSAELSASWEARLAAVEARHSEHLHARLAAVEAERLGWRSTRRVRAGARRRPCVDFQLSRNQWPINGQPHPGPMRFAVGRRRRGCSTATVVVDGSA